MTIRGAKKAATGAIINSNKALVLEAELRKVFKSPLANSIARAIGTSPMDELTTPRHLTNGIILHLQHR